MAIKVYQPDGTYKYKCNFCNKVFDKPDYADAHRDEEHDLIYLQILRSDVDRILKFLYMKEDSLVTETMVNSLRLGLKQKNDK